mmetsp:Transcript_26536/g.62357  ORF Transcript_26536/g.62357 Transcript_26536/m.62357 type:complete len:368 (+) Transcript_26536:97-1200(+)
MPSSSLSTNELLECSASIQDDIDKKRRQLLIRSAKRPFKRSRLIQQQQQQQQKQKVQLKQHREVKDETDTITTASISSESATTKNSMCQKSKFNHRRRHKTEKPHKLRTVSFDTKYNEMISVPSHKDLSDAERRSYFLQRDEYLGIKRKIQKTIEFLRSPNDVSTSSGTTSRSETSLGNIVEEEHCVRGLECLAEEFVNDHKRRVQKTSKSAVFRFQEKRRRMLGATRTMLGSKDDNKRSKLLVDTHEVSFVLAKIYRKHTSQCEDIARRWGHFDAIDAGYDPTSSPATVVNCATTASKPSKPATVGNNIIVENPIDNNASLSSLSYDGDDGEEENENNEDFNLPPVVNTEESAHGFDSLPNGLFNF